MNWPDDYINKVICGDSLEVMKEIPDGAVDCVITDPPYGISGCGWDSVIPLEEMWLELRRITKELSPIVLCAGQPFTSKLVVSNFEEFKTEWIWHKEKGSNFMHLDKNPFKEHESVLVFCRNSDYTFNPILQKRHAKYENLQRCKTPFHRTGGGEAIGELKRGGKRLIHPTMRHPSSVQQFNRPKSYTGVHPTQKPLDLMAYMVTTYSNTDSVVLDFTCGSGTTLVAAKQLGRKYIGIEISPEYCKIAEDRLRQEELFS